MPLNQKPFVGLDDWEVENYLTVLQTALDTALVGGNHLASELVGHFGPNVFTDWTYEHARLAIQDHDGHDWVHWYEVWCAWKACMTARNLARDHLADLPEDKVLPALRK